MLRLKNRRELIKSTSAITAGAFFSSDILPSPFIGRTEKHPACIFPNSLQSLDYNPLGEAIVQIDFDGAGLSVLAERHVPPDNISIDLPKAVKALRKAGIKVPMMVTDINNSDYRKLREF